VGPADLVRVVLRVDEEEVGRPALTDHGQAVGVELDRAAELVASTQP
jgi:hypothetical protein